MKMANNDFEYAEEENMTFEAFDTEWYIHPLYQGWASSESGDIIYISKRKILRPKMTPEGMVIYVSNGHGFKLYNVDKFVYEVFNDIEMVTAKIQHIDGDLTNNSVLNLKIEET